MGSQEDGAPWGGRPSPCSLCSPGEYDEAGSYDEDEDVEEDYQEEDADTSATPEEAGGGGTPPTYGPQNQEFTPMCNNENCWIRVDWEPPPRDAWMSCLLGYRVGFRK